MKRLKKHEREINQHWPWPLNIRCLCHAPQLTEHRIGPYSTPHKVTGKLIEVITTRDRCEDIPTGGYIMHPVRPTRRPIYPFEIIAGPEWRIRPLRWGRWVAFCFGHFGSLRSSRRLAGSERFSPISYRFASVSNPVKFKTGKRFTS
jgi:hypothetical protein